MASKVFKFNNEYTAHTLAAALNAANLSYGKVTVEKAKIGGVEMVVFPKADPSLSDQAAIMFYGKVKPGKIYETNCWQFLSGGHYSDMNNLAGQSVKNMITSKFGILGALFGKFNSAQRKQDDLFKVTVQEIERLGL